MLRPLLAKLFLPLITFASPLPLSFIGKISSMQSPKGYLVAVGGAEDKGVDQGARSVK